MVKTSISAIVNAAAVVLLAAGSARYLGPSWPFAILSSLQIYLASVVALTLVLNIAVSRSRASLLLMLPALALAGHALIMMAEFAISPTADELARGPQFRVMSFNMLSTNIGSGHAVAQAIRASGVDVAVILEGGELRAELPNLDRVYPFRIGCGQQTLTCDSLIFSKYPLSNIEVADLSDLRRDRYLAATVASPAGRFRVVSAHLSKPYFDEFQMVELRKLQALVHKEKGPVIVAGDFNSATISPPVQQVIRYLKLRTAPVEPGTWPVPGANTGLGIPIDHLYSRLPLVPLKVERMSDAYGSNHFGLIADFAFRLPASG